MKQYITPFLAISAFALSLVMVSTPVSAHGNVSCKSGPKSAWVSVDKLKAQLVKQGWTIKKAKPEKDCYEVYGKTPEGDNVEAFFHPVSFKKIMVMKRGKMLYRAPGY